MPTGVPPSFYGVLLRFPPLPSGIRTPPPRFAPQLPHSCHPWTLMSVWQNGRIFSSISVGSVALPNPGNCHREISKCLWDLKAPADVFLGMELNMQVFCPTLLPACFFFSWTVCCGDRGFTTAPSFRWTGCFFRVADRLLFHVSRWRGAGKVVKFRWVPRNPPAPPGGEGVPPDLFRSPEGGLWICGCRPHPPSPRA